MLLACGVAGGISGIFNAPMTGLIFAIEVVLAEWSYPAWAATGAIFTPRVIAWLTQPSDAARGR